MAESFVVVVAFFVVFPYLPWIFTREIVTYSTKRTSDRLVVLQALPFTSFEIDTPRRFVERPRLFS